VLSARCGSRHCWRHSAGHACSECCVTLSVVIELGIENWKKNIEVIVAMTMQLGNSGQWLLVMCFLFVIYEASSTDTHSSPGKPVRCRGAVHILPVGLYTTAWKAHLAYLDASLASSPACMFASLITCCTRSDAFVSCQTWSAPVTVATHHAVIVQHNYEYNSRLTVYP